MPTLCKCELPVSDRKCAPWRAPGACRWHHSARIRPNQARATPANVTVELLICALTVVAGCRAASSSQVVALRPELVSRVMCRGCERCEQGAPEALSSAPAHRVRQAWRRTQDGAYAIGFLARATVRTVSTPTKQSSLLFRPFRCTLCLGISISPIRHQFGYCSVFSSSQQGLLP